MCRAKAQTLSCVVTCTALVKGGGRRAACEGVNNMKKGSYYLVSSSTSGDATSIQTCPFQRLCGLPLAHTQLLSMLIKACMHGSQLIISRAPCALLTAGYNTNSGAWCIVQLVAAPECLNNEAQANRLLQWMWVCGGVRVQTCAQAHTRAFTRHVCACHLVNLTHLTHS